MATLEDRILGEKLQYYCSSSEDEDESGAKGEESKDATRTGAIVPSAAPPPEVRQWEGCSVNTGPKGVLRDWQRFKQLESEKREQQEQERLQLIKKLSLTCKSDLDAEKQDRHKQAEKETDDVQEEIEDNFLKEYMRKRMEEMVSQINARPKFGQLITLPDGQAFLDAVDKEKSGLTVIVHVFSAVSCF